MHSSYGFPVDSSGHLHIASWSTEVQRALYAHFDPIQGSLHR